MTSTRWFPAPREAQGHALLPRRPVHHRPRRTAPCPCDHAKVTTIQLWVGLLDDNYQDAVDDGWEGGRAGDG